MTSLALENQESEYIIEVVNEAFNNFRKCFLAGNLNFICFEERTGDEKFYRTEVWQASDMYEISLYIGIDEDYPEYFAIEWRFTDVFQLDPRRYSCLKEEELETYTRLAAKEMKASIMFLTRENIV